MINADKIIAAIEKYKEHFPAHWAEEKYKWEAIICFQDNWDINADNFGEMFKKATAKTSNLLASGYAYPREMILKFAKADDKATREMFAALFDESIDLSERIKTFIKTADGIRAKYDDGTWRNHYQNTNAISTYLWLMFPDKYYIYKLDLFKSCAELFDDSYRPKSNGAVNNVIDGYKMYDEIRKMLNSALTESCYNDPDLVTLTIDFGHYIGRFYDDKISIADADTWYGLDYDPGLTVDDWVNLLNNREVFTESSLAIMKRMKDIGGMATCIQLAEKYGETFHFYSGGSVGIAQRVCKVAGIENTHADKTARWWTVLYTGKKAKEDEPGSILWRLRDELSQALDMVDLSDIPLYADGKEPITTPTDGIRYWLYAPGEGAVCWEEFCSLGIMGLGWEEIGDLRTYPDKEAIRKKMVEVYEEEGSHKMSVLATWQFANEIKPGDIIYAKKGRSTIIGKGIVTSGYIFDKSRSQYNNIRRVIWTHKGHWQLPYLATIKTLTDITDYKEFLAKLESFFANETSPTYSPYTPADFLHDVYMTQAEYETLSRLLFKKKNVILQGAPGVGKTFAAKRLAYSIMGCKDSSRVEFVQFHQSYSYEDFIMGYRPFDDGSFALCEGIFYKFCKKAETDPEREYFFIIDEINRGNLSKIFGELLMLIEADKRGDREYSVKLTYNDELFSVPENLYIIGMMNTADRSLAIIDYALRRRFSFFDMHPGFDSDGFRAYAETLESSAFYSLVDAVKALNREIAGDPALGEGFCIGHSYLCNLTKESASADNLQAIIDYDIVPLFREYWFDDKEKADNWCIKLHNAIDR